MKEGENKGGSFEYCGKGLQARRMAYEQLFDISIDRR